MKLVGSNIFALTLTIDKIRSTIDRCNEIDCQAIVRFSGGAIFGVAKAIGAFAPQFRAAVENTRC